ncbi:DUF4198 domain-containing protein [Yoonia sp. 2307UL14-13]|uniref:DUF4198 domain-containing protein n=1 Tax=Yoonia sp. 2307UL14-13 TaxID=3126506 RepID=UPI0030B60AFF
MRILPLLFALAAAPVAAHELWIEPLAYQVGADGNIAAHIVNGEEFEGTNLAFLPRDIQNFVMFANDQTVRVDSRLGDRPALDRSSLGDGLHIVAYQTNPSTVNYPNWEKFQKFIDHKDLGDLRPIHNERGLPEEDFLEVYTRYSKSLIGVGDAAGGDRRVGMETELVALTNPYTDDMSDGMRVQLYYRNDVRGDEQIEVFEKAPDGQVEITLHRTDSDGIGTFDVKPGHAYMVDAVYLREPSERLATETRGVWETMWANLTFAVPE